MYSTRSYAIFVTYIIGRDRTSVMDLAYVCDSNLQLRFQRMFLLTAHTFRVSRAKSPIINEALRYAKRRNAGLESLIGRYRKLRCLDEPPDTDPHVRWCERGRLAAAPIRIKLMQDQRT